MNSTQNSSKIPEKGFYYHYKHNPAISIQDHAYEVIGVALHTEERTFTVIYRPLYKNTFLGEADFCSRPIGMFFEDVEVNGKVVQRFIKITDADVISKLKDIRDFK